VAGTHIKETTIMAKLNDTQLMILSAASRRRDFSAYPLPKTVKAGDGPKLLKKLLALNMLEETEAVGDTVVWREHEDGYKLTLVLADDGFKALGLAREEQAIAKAKPKATEKAASKQGSRQERLVAMLHSSKGATIDELCHEFGWQPHSARAIISVTIRRKLGLAVTSEKVNNRGRVYKVAA
jgi:hypothetical protein